MKQYFIRAVSTSSIGTSNGVLLGYVGEDQASGGYPYNNGLTPVNNRKDYCEAYMNWVATKTKMSEMTDGGLKIPSDVDIFFSAYKKTLGFISIVHKTVKQESILLELKIEMIELDLTDIMNVKSKLIRVIQVEGIEAEDWKTRDKAYYKIVSDVTANS